MSRVVVVLLGFWAGCIQSNAVVCGDRVCPQDTVCIELMASAGDPHRCVEEKAVSACNGIDELGLCSAGACYATTSGLVCLPSGCGNGLVDTGEVCDDGNADVGDGCSAACRSNEVCGNGILDGLALDDTGTFIPGEACDDANLLGHDGCDSTCDAERPAWTDVTPRIPARRMRAPMAYDPIRRRVVMVGGHQQEGPPATPETPLSDVWEYDGRQWVQRHPSDAPSARIGAAVAYDAATRSVLLFGGFDSHVRADTWAWNGARWRLLAPGATPPARYRHGMAYDGRRKVVVLFGGTDEQSNPLGDTWEWSGASWKQIAPATSPSPREAAMAYDPVRGVIVMVGQPADGVDYETWEYDGATWTQKAIAMAAPSVPPGGSPPTSIAFDAASSQVVALGPSTTYSWDGTAWTNHRVGVGPGTTTDWGSYEGASLAETPGRQVVLFGGRYDTCPPDTSCFSQSFANRNRTFVWTGTAWNEQLLDAPEPRYFAGATLDTTRRVVVVVGGTDGTTAFQQTLEYDGFGWTKPSGSPWSSGRFSASIAYDEANDQIVVFGGADAALAVNAETWVRTGMDWTNPTVVTSPPARGEAAMAYDPKRHEVVLFGGGASAGDAGISFDDTWVWDGTTWTQRLPEPRPAARRGAVLAWDPSSEQLVLFGGRTFLTTGTATSEVKLSDTWTWDGTAWTEHTSLLRSPSPRHRAAFATDAARGTLVLFGGEDASGTVADSWEWNGTAWRPLPAVDSPSGRSGHAMTSSPDGAGLVVFGGADASSTALGETRRLQWSGDVDYETCALETDTDGDGLAGCGDPDCWARCTPSCGPRTCDSTSPPSPYCGDGTCSALEDCRICPADCTTCPDRCGDTVCDPAETADACPGDCTP